MPFCDLLKPFLWPMVIESTQLIFCSWVLTLSRYGPCRSADFYSGTELPAIQARVQSNLSPIPPEGPQAGCRGSVSWFSMQWRVSGLEDCSVLLLHRADDPFTCSEGSSVAVGRLPGMQRCHRAGSHPRPRAECASRGTWSHIEQKCSLSLSRSLSLCFPMASFGLFSSVSVPWY